MMESDLGKLFIGGISWDTDEERLREYFKKFGEVVEAVIMKDRHTGRARGFGFVVFSDPAVADRVVSEKHLIDGRMVEAKKAVPRDDQQIMNRNNNGVQNFSGPGRTKKIFVGGLASTVTDVDFRKYFEQFGAITDVVVMYDHNTQRPRGFGFITFDSEDAVEKVLHKTFHQLNGKMVEVKKAVPKELSPGPNLRLPIGSYNFDLNRVNSFLNGYSQGYNPSYIGSYPMRMDGRFGPLAGERKGFHSFNPGYGIGMNYDPVMSPSYGGNSNYSSTVGYGRALSSYSSGNSSRFGSPIGYSGGSGTLGSSFTSAARSLWGNGVLNYKIDPANSNSYISRSEGPGGLGLNWGGSSSTLTSHGASINTGFIGGNLSYGSGENSFSLGASSYGSSGRSSGNGPVNNSFTATNKGYKGNYTDSFCNSSIYGDPTWESASSELDGSSPFGYGLGAAASNIRDKGSPDYLASYNVTNWHINGEG
ncbi:Heterogeneous nuclear ribonucleoprotein 1 [Apostasia shenzhenica]|uniref:Heterogeneous nuclear ribonucleoprotein 1 n=1 Tax=Apostasia shenzhenica TaxID=1088818 RepID=A0A2I0ARN9_9ASPA|nr:Heterogeneous nuclear ribonucleoprotein 1 [Apostasia shenzhenica]